MSWFAKSLATTLNLNDDDDNSESSHPNPQTESPTHPNSDPTDSSNRGVKEDLSELKKTLTRNFWGVASFLAPPPPSSSDSDPNGSDPDDSDSPVIPNIRNDFAEIGGKFRSGISKISNNMAVVSEITSKMASNFLQLGVENEEGRDYYEFGAVGVTDRVVDFVRDVVMHPETWLDFPLPDSDDEEDFDMSDAQQEHALAVERLVPRLAALRMELCPGYMSETCFWKIYFVLLHPRLDQHDAEVLSTPQIVKARSLLTQNNLRNNSSAKSELDTSRRETLSIEEDMKSPAEEFLSAPSATRIKSVPVETSALESAPPQADIETEKHPVLVNEVRIVDKSVIQEENVIQKKKQNLPSTSSSNVLGETDEDDADDWLKEETSETVSSSDKIIPIDNDEDVSFSDLEDEGDVPTSYKKKDSRDWVQLDGSKQDRHDPENKYSNDWLDLDEIEVE
ncbi:hypothetical protein DCAR_0624805 [Daucus carota subsp. sativus]|uniref:BSD domain-containing protein n=1 Tax=Daucus carota subsp. sativus TaxID=79200 RepID=A0AAF1B3L9_DAUCS|nr:PREDICTED: uncharacterized protein LOC108228094 [Daucus carota subsp. sativus]WOH05389.1 hypothetical protein DCAR_0624805 [Daucus carota subsp. sativus]